MNEDAVFDEITRLSAQGNELMDQEKYAEAREIFLKALKLEPEHWSETACWLDAAIGDSYYQEEKYENSLKYFQDAYYAIGGKMNPYVLFMNGMCYYKLGNKDEAGSYLANTYALDGNALFEDEDPECLELARTYGS